MNKSDTAQGDKLSALLSSVTFQDVKATGKQLLTIEDRRRNFAQLCSDNMDFWTNFSQELIRYDDVDFEDAML